MNPRSASLDTKAASGASNDIGFAVDGAPVPSAAALQGRIGLAPIGRSVRLTVERDGVERTVAARVGPAR
jgi:serine protease DegQ